MKIGAAWLRLPLASAILLGGIGSGAAGAVAPARAGGECKTAGPTARLGVHPEGARAPGVPVTGGGEEALFVVAVAVMGV